MPTNLRDASRALRATPIVSAVAILSLALGIGANTAIFSIVNALLLRALPVSAPERLVQVLPAERRSSWTNPLWEQLRDRSGDLFDGAFAYSTMRFNLARGGEAELISGVIASGGFFDVLGVPATLGRTFTRADDVPGGGKDGPVAVISYAFWQRRYGGAADVIGKPIVLDRVPFTIIGVTEPRFTGVDQGSRYDVAVPLATEPLIRGAKESAMHERSWWWLRVIARLRPGDTIDRAAATLRGVQPQVREAARPDQQRPQEAARFLKDPFALRPAANGPNAVGRQYRLPLFILTALVALVLLIACANIANLLLARASARRHELSIRAALGASRWRIARQLLAESALLSVSGAMLGLAVAHWGARLLVFELSGPKTADALDVGADWRVLLFTAAVAAATTALFGTVPALRAMRVAPGEAIKEQGRAIAGDARAGFGSVMVVAQVALSLVLVVGAGLFVRTFSRLAHVQLGFDPDPLLLVDANVKRSAIAPGERVVLFERMREAVLGVPGVRAAALQIITPLSGDGWNGLLDNPEGLSLSEADREVYINGISPGWFATSGIPILSGRDFTVQDTPASPRVILVNETFARRYFPGANPIGRSVRNVARPGVNPPWMLIIGVVRDAVYLSPRDRIPPTMYQALLQLNERPLQGVTIVVRPASGSPVLLTRPVVEAVARVDADATLVVRRFSENLRDVTAQERVIAMLSGFFGGLALLLAGLGLYGIMSYAVSRRRTEIGIRIALGAGPSRAVALVLRRVAWLVALGVAAGAVLSLWAAPLVAALLFGLEPRDPSTLAAAIVTLAAIGTLAGWLPARRAARIDPARVLRES
jgi:putative ABC transport system permease protein